MKLLLSLFILSVSADLVRYDITLTKGKGDQKVMNSSVRTSTPNREVVVEVLDTSLSFTGRMTPEGFAIDGQFFIEGEERPWRYHGITNMKQSVGFIRVLDGEEYTFEITPRWIERNATMTL